LKRGVIIVANAPLNVRKRTFEVAVKRNTFRLDAKGRVEIDSRLSWVGRNVTDGFIDLEKSVEIPKAMSVFVSHPSKEVTVVEIEREEGTRKKLGSTLAEWDDLGDRRPWSQ
jgi:hypothetical protein